MAEVPRDLELEKKINEWKKFFGYRTVDDFEASLLSRAAAWETTITASVYNGLPPTPFKIQIGSEKMEVSKVSGHTLWVTRGIEGTIAQIHSVGDKVSICQP